MEFASITSPGAALVAGLVTSFHCAGMCGPLSCTLMPVRQDQGDPLMLGTAYHGGRLVSYSLLGAVAGGLGQLPLAYVSEGALRWLPWTMVLVFLGIAFRWDRFLPKFTKMTLFSWRIQAWGRRRSRVTAAASLGLATPLLPCGPLYFVLSIALLAGSAVRGIEIMLAFALGTTPLLWLAQSRMQWLKQRLGAQGLGRLQLSVALVSACVIAWRLRGTLGFGGPEAGNFACY